MAEERREPGRVPAIILAVLVHIAFIAVLVFGVDWQTREPAPVIAELWNSLPGIAQPLPPPPEPKPEPKPEPEPEPPKSEPPTEPKQEPKAAKADIALKAKETKRKEDEEKKRIEKRKEEERKKEEETKRKETEKKKQEEIKRKEELLKQERELQQQELNAATAGIQARQQAAARNSLVNDYKGRIVAKIKPLIVNQPCAPLSNPEVEFEVRLMPGGIMLPDLRLKKSSGSAQCDQAIERAILRAQPLPLPPDPALFGDFRELNLKFRPNE